jgi:hypothetical protein
VQLNKNLREFIELLNSHRVEYIIVGAYAPAFHGYPQYASDLKLLVNPSAVNARRVVAALVDFGFPSFGLASAEFTAPNHVVQIGHSPGQIDLLTSISGASFTEVWQSRETATLDGVPVSYTGREDFVRKNTTSGSI